MKMKWMSENARWKLRQEHRMKVEWNSGNGRNLRNPKYPKSDYHNTYLPESEIRTRDRSRCDQHSSQLHCRDGHSMSWHYLERVKLTVNKNIQCVTCWIAMRPCMPWWHDPKANIFSSCAILYFYVTVNETIKCFSVLTSGEINPMTK